MTPVDTSTGTVPLRFSITSQQALPLSLCDKLRLFVHNTVASPREQSPRVRGLYSLSLWGLWEHACTASCRPDTCPELASIRKKLIHICAPYPVDSALIYGSMAEYGPRLIVTDVDTTFITGEVIEMLAKEAGSEEKVRDITTRAMCGELDFSQSLAERVRTLQGVHTDAFAHIAHSIELTEGAKQLVDAAHAHNVPFGLVSGGFHEVVDVFAKPLGIDYILANRLEVSEQKLTGHTTGPIIDREAKATAIRSWSDALNIPLDTVLVAGDGANDLSMMKIAGFSVAFRAKPRVREQASTALSIERLDAICALVGWDCPKTS